MSQRLGLVLMLGSALLAGCASHDVVVLHEPAPNVAVTDYPRYHLVVTPAEEASPTHWMVEKAIHDDLRAKGYVPVDRASADLIVSYETVVDDDSEFKAAHAIDGSLAKRKSAQKQIAITLLDAERLQPVWRGTAEGEVHPGRMTASIQNAVADILAGIPGRS